MHHNAASVIISEGVIVGYTKPKASYGIVIYQRAHNTAAASTYDIVAIVDDRSTRGESLNVNLGVYRQVSRRPREGYCTASIGKGNSTQCGRGSRKLKGIPVGKVCLELDRAVHNQIARLSSLLVAETSAAISKRIGHVKESISGDSHNAVRRVPYQCVTGYVREGYRALSGGRAGKLDILRRTIVLKRHRATSVDTAVYTKIRYLPGCTVADNSLRRAYALRVNVDIAYLVKPFRQGSKRNRNGITGDVSNTSRDGSREKGKV
jgi:hypothetical protein